MTLSALFLDMDNTLCDTQEADEKAVRVLANWLEKSHHPSGAEAAAQCFNDAVYRRFDLSTWLERIPAQPDDESYRKALLAIAVEEKMNLSLSDDEALECLIIYNTTRMHHIKYYDGVPDCLKRLRKHYTLVVITNGPLYSQKPKAKALAIQDQVDHLILAGEYEHQKPHPSLFNLALEKAACPPEEAIHIGDQLKSDIQGAQGIGIHGVWVSHGQTLPNDSIVPEHTIEKFIDIEDLIKKYY